MQRTAPRRVDEAMDAAHDLGLERMRAWQLEQELALLRNAQKPRRHWTQSFPVVILCWLVFIAVGVRFAPHLYGWWYGWEDGKARTEAMPTAAVATPRPTSAAALDQPVTSYGGQDGSDPLPTPDPGILAYNAAQAERATQFATEDALAETPLPGEFWTEAEKAAFAAAEATATAQAWVEAEAETTAFIQDIPTPAPEVVAAMDEKCGDAGLVEKSPLLQLWCPSITEEGE